MNSINFGMYDTKSRVGYLPVWRKRWFLRFVCLLKPREQIWHLNGHDPLWTYMWERRSPGVGNDFEQRLHLCGFSCWKETKIMFNIRVSWSTKCCSLSCNAREFELLRTFHIDLESLICCNKPWESQVECATWKFLVEHKTKWNSTLFCLLTFMWVIRW